MLSIKGFNVPWSWLIIFVLVCLLLLQRQCGCPKCPEPTVVIKHDTIFKTIVSYVPKPVTIIKPSKPIEKPNDTIYIPLPFDSITHIDDYFTKKFYSDTVKTKDYVVVIEDTVSRNRITNRVFKYKNLIDCNGYDKIPQEDCKRKLYLFIGPIIGGNKDKFIFGGQVAVIDKKLRGYTYSYDLINKTHSLGILWKIGFNKK